LGVNLLQPAGKAVFFNDRAGILLVRATEQDLDIIDKAIQILNQAPPQVHIKARFIEVSQTDDKSIGFDWYMGQFQIGNQAVGTGGSSPSLNVPTSPANPLGAFPGNTATTIIPASANDQLITAGLRNTGPTLGTITGILTDPNFRVALHALEQRGGFENLGEPEVTTMSGRQAQMRATQVITVITDINFQAGTGGGVTSGTTGAAQ
jgi:type II secretory pathway component GspD/PulD (secretin)